MPLFICRWQNGDFSAVSGLSPLGQLLEQR